jgi:hypothetical protein
MPDESLVPQYHGGALAGALPAFFTFWIRRRVREPAVWVRRSDAAAPRLATFPSVSLPTGSVGGALSFCS